MAGENPKIGLDNVVIAPVLSDDSTGITYGDVIALKGAVNATVNPNSDVAVDYADNGAFFVTNNRGNTELTLEFTNIDPATMAAMLGQARSNGITRETSMDQAPYYAMGFRVWIGGTDASGNNIYEYMWYAKGKFSVPESGAETKGESINFQHVNMTAQFVSTQFIPDGESAGTICTHCRSDIDTASSVIENWFNAPVVSLTVDSGAVTVSGTLSDDTITLTGAKTGGASFSFASSSIVLGSSVVVLDSDGVAVEGTVTVSAASASPTITIVCEDTPATVIVTSAVKDSYGVGVTPASITLA